MPDNVPTTANTPAAGKQPATQQANQHPSVSQSQPAPQHIGSTAYVRVRRLGSGAYGEVVLARHAVTREEVAIKLTSRISDPLTLRYLEQEIINQRVLRHPHVIEFKEIFVAGPGQIGIAMEYAQGGSLFTFVQRKGRLPENDARWFFQQLCMALDFCHQRKVAHRDIKLENLLLKPVQGVPLPLLKMCDFGFSKVYEKGAPLLSRVGTLAYMAPEVFQDSGYSGSSADVWSCGVVLYVMLVGQYPFGAAVQDRDKKAVMERVVRGQWSIPPDLVLSDPCRDLLTRILVPQPAQRLAMDGVMSHPWFMTNLPPGALEYNRSLLQQPINETLLQPTDDIKRALTECVASRGRHVT